MVCVCVVISEEGVVRIHGVCVIISEEWGVGYVTLCSYYYITSYYLLLRYVMRHKAAISRWEGYWHASCYSGYFIYYSFPFPEWLPFLNHDTSSLFFSLPSFPTPSPISCLLISIPYTFLFLMWNQVTWHDLTLSLMVSKPTRITFFSLAGTSGITDFVSTSRKDGKINTTSYLIKRVNVIKTENEVRWVGVLHAFFT